MTIWDVLGIESMQDEAEIRRAYSAMLKLHRPDDDPDGYQMLRWAYEAALAFAKSPSAAPPAVTDSEAVWEEPEESLPEAILEQGTTTKEKVDAFIRQVKALYDDFAKRIETAQWEELLKSEVLSDIGAHEQIAKQMLDVLSQRHHFPREIWRLLETHFHWTTESTGYEPRLRDLIRYIDRQTNFGLTLTQYRRLDPAGAESYLTDLDLLSPIGELFDREECERRVAELAVRYPTGNEIYILEQLYYFYYINDMSDKNYLRILSLAELERCLTILIQLTEIDPYNSFFMLETIALCIKTDRFTLAEECYELALVGTQEKERVKAWYNKELQDHAQKKRLLNDSPVGREFKYSANAVPANYLAEKAPTKEPSRQNFMNTEYPFWLLLFIILFTLEDMGQMGLWPSVVYLGVLVVFYIILKIWAKKA